MILTVSHKPTMHARRILNIYDTKEKDRSKLTMNDMRFVN